MSRRFATLVFVVFCIHEALVFFLLWSRDQEIESLENELQSIQTRFMQIEQENKQLRERQRIWEIIEEFNPRMSEPEKTSLSETVYEESRRYGYDPVLLLALIHTESSFRSDARSVKGAQGLMQIMPAVGQALTPEMEKALDIESVTKDLYDPEINVRLGAYYLFKLVHRFEDVKMAIRAYNEGPTDIQKRLDRGRPLPRQYYSKVEKNYHMLLEFLEEKDLERVAEAGPAAMATPVLSDAS
jgi:soluble lytic murein transglycosylase